MQFTFEFTSILALFLIFVQISTAAVLPIDYSSYGSAVNNGDVPALASEDGLFLGEPAPVPSKRAQTFVRFGKRAQTFVRFGKRGQTFVRFGRSAPLDA